MAGLFSFHPCQHPSPNIILTVASLSALDLIYKVREFSSPLLSFHFNVEKTNLQRQKRCLFCCFKTNKTTHFYTKLWDTQCQGKTDNFQSLKGIKCLSDTLNLRLCIRRCVQFTHLRSFELKTYGFMRSLNIWTAVHTWANF